MTATTTTTLPADLGDIAVSHYRLRASRPGSLDYTRTITIKADRPTAREAARDKAIRIADRAAARGWHCTVTAVGFTPTSERSQQIHAAEPPAIQPPWPGAGEWR